VAASSVVESLGKYNITWKVSLTASLIVALILLDSCAGV
jgi:hypothetical protein